MTRTFRIGESCAGGIIQVEITQPSIIRINILDYHSKVCLHSDVFLATESDCRNRIDEVLNEVTTSYYAETVLEYIEDKIRLS
jgi:hypothetical protein